MATLDRGLFEAPVSHEINPYSNSELEEEWETNPEVEADQFLPLLAVGAKLAGKMLAKKLALKGAKKLALKGAKKLISRAPKVLNKLNKLQRSIPNDRPQSVASRPPQPAPVSRLQTARSLVEQLRNVLSEGESQATALEAQFFGANEFEGELAGHEAAHEIALTEVLAAEASHTTSEGEAEALLGAALPITIRVMGGSPMLRRATPLLLRANVDLVRNLHRQGRDGRQFLRIVSGVHRRTIASLRALERRGRPITPDLVSQILRAHTARILSRPQVLGPLAIRNFAIRRSTVGAIR